MINKYLYCILFFKNLYYTSCLYLIYSFFYFIIYLNIICKVN
nr:MAG TPA: hypothetical protein [Ackermannviridae sp.]